ncbi:MAG: HD domain-containing protein [Oligoflexia bacterium]|nr:HD domain-containing protein [Oligoflexia bacterium]MBF0366645.1 HD domain-containing protein [Oligoflexia bacterium]
MEYTPIRISTVMPKTAITFALYIYFKDQFIKYLDMGKSLDEELLSKLKKQKIARFYIRDIEELNYQKYLDDVLGKTMDDPQVNMVDKINFAEGSATTAVEDMQKDPTSKQSYNTSKRAAKTLRRLISENPDSLKNFYGRAGNENDMLIKHCLNVSALAVGLAKVNAISEEDQDTLALAGLLHDVGISQLKESEQALFTKEYKQMSAEEKVIYHQHPTLGSDVIKKNELVTPDIIELVLCHEEKISGNGYPNKKSKLTLAQEILSLCNSYDKRVTIFKVSAKDALKAVQMDELGNYNLELINKFKKQLKEDGIVV